MASWSSSSSSTWMLLPLLLVFFHTVHPLPIASVDIAELERQVELLGDAVKNCTQHCSFPDISNKNCHFLNLTEAFKLMQTEDDQKPVCASRHYFISGIEFYRNILSELPAGHCSIGKLNFPHLIRKLKNVTLQSPPCECEDKLPPIISPYTLLEVLCKKIQRFNSAG